MQDSMTPELWYHNMGAHYLSAIIYFHLNRTGIIHFLYERDEASSSEIESALNLDGRLVEELLFFVSRVDQIVRRNEDGKYGFSEFGRQVLKRYQRSDGGKLKFNFHDVRVGGYGPVWNDLGNLLRKSKSYGVDVKRDGAFIEDGLYTLSVGFMPPLMKGIETVNPKHVVEFGANTGLSTHAAKTKREMSFYAVDKNLESIGEARERLESDPDGRPVQWIHSNIFNPEQWVTQLGSDHDVCIHSVHFHEFVKDGVEPLVELVGKLGKLLRKPRVLVMEIPLHSIDDRKHMKDSLWLYTHANVLIHHLVKSGRILPAEEWIRVFESGGGHLVSRTQSGYLGYEVFDFQL